MSGGGGGGGGRSRSSDNSSRALRDQSSGSGGASGGADTCRQISELLRIQSPKPAAIRSLQVGDQLRVTASRGGPPLILTTTTGVVAGSLVPSAGQKVLDCINAGHSFAATVLSIKGGICTVRLQAQ